MEKRRKIVREVLKPTQVLTAERSSEKQSAIHKPLVVAKRKRVIALQHKCSVSTVGRKFAVMYCCRGNFLYSRAGSWKLAMKTTVWASLIIIFPAIDSKISPLKAFFFACVPSYYPTRAKSISSSASGVVVGVRLRGAPLFLPDNTWQCFMRLQWTFAPADFTPLEKITQLHIVPLVPPHQARLSIPCPNSFEI